MVRILVNNNPEFEARERDVSKEEEPGDKDSISIPLLQNFKFWPTFDNEYKEWKNNLKGPKILIWN